MKSNKEIIEYLKPYTEMEGIYLKNKIMVTEKERGIICDYMIVQIDIKSSWKGIGGTDTRHQTIKQYLTKNGFIYNEHQHHYVRPYQKKYWRK